MQCRFCDPLSLILKKIDIVLSHFENASSGMGELIYTRYRQLKLQLQAGNLTSNPINGSVRAYLDAYNDWDNSVLVIMSELEKEINSLIKKNGHL